MFWLHSKQQITFPPPFDASPLNEFLIQIARIDVTLCSQSNRKYHAYLIRFRMSMSLRTVLDVHTSHLYGFAKEHRNPQHKFRWIKRFCGFEMVNCTWHLDNAKKAFPSKCKFIFSCCAVFMTRLWKIPLSKRAKKIMLAGLTAQDKDREIYHWRFTICHSNIHTELICGKSIKFTLFSSS